jgi:hypothetical protein
MSGSAAAPEFRQAELPGDQEFAAAAALMGRPVPAARQQAPGLLKQHLT